MRGRAVFLVALLLAAAGTSLVYLYSRDADARAAAGHAGHVRLLVAADVPANTPAGALEVTAQEAFDVLPGEVTDLRQVAGEVTGVELVSGSPLIRGMFTDPRAPGLDRGHYGLQITAQFPPSVRPGAAVEVLDARGELLLSAHVLTVDSPGLLTLNLSSTDITANQSAARLFRAEQPLRVILLAGSP
jgi:hypothetical protein